MKNDSGENRQDQENLAGSFRSKDNSVIIAQDGIGIMVVLAIGMFFVVFYYC